MWSKYFKLKGLVPGRVVVAGYGEIDFSQNVPVETCRELFENDWPFIDITEEGKLKFYDIGKPDDLKPLPPEFSLPDADEHPQEEKVSKPVEKPKRKRTSRKNTQKPE